MGTPLTAAALPDLRARLPHLTLRDEDRLRRRLDRAVRLPGDRKQAALDEVAAAVAAAEERIVRRRAGMPELRYPEELPVSARRADLLAAIRDHQVVVVAGETGSGKTTQLPKICLELGRGVRGMIGHTQPRRLAARAVAERVSDELGTSLGEAVGYAVRFTDRVGDDTLVKLMTDGILLAEIQHDRHLLRYDTLIIDEAHERSLNIDFLLGYLHRLLPRRPDLKVVITSATIDPERFARHFGGAPVVEVSGRTYPVEMRYRPLDDPDAPAEPPASGRGRSDAAAGSDRENERDQTQAILDAVDELSAEGPGDILVFLSGEREIRDTADAVRRHQERRGRTDTEVLPLYARLSAAEQHRVFAPHRGRRIVLATNVAETSLTVPGIHYVIDPGTARISRYSHRTKVQRLPIEPVSQASANQRAGRCGRIAAGVCVRLYSEDDFAARAEFTDPEILRTNLASVILQMTALGLGDVGSFPFIDPPDRRNIRDGVALLHELGALEEGPGGAAHGAGEQRRRLTPLGRRLARMPIDPRLARMVLEAERHGCVREVAVIAAGLSIQDPRERPADRREAADARHARFADDTSDFLAYLRLWHHLTEQQRELSGSRFRRMCRDEFLNYLRVREWQDLVAQLVQVLRGLDVPVGRLPEVETLEDPGKRRAIHTSLMAGLLSHLGMKDPEKGDFLGARGARFAVFPGSALFRKPPTWVMAGELVETSRLWARVVARIEPEWAEELAGHLVKRTYSEPHWEKRRGGVVASEKVTLYGVPIVASRRVDYGRIDPELSRELFIRHALVEGDWQTHHPFLAHNRRLLAEAEELEHRTRRRDVVVDDEVLFDFYDRRIGPEAVSGRHFDAWWKKARREQPDLLTFTPDLVVREGTADTAREEYPDTWRQGDLEFRLSYQFEPGTAEDGVSVRIPLAVVNQVDADDFTWQVPGLRAELVTALIRSLPKQLRRGLVPVPTVAQQALDRVRPRSEPLLSALERVLTELGGSPVQPSDWQLDRVPDHLRVTFVVVDDRGREVGHGKDLPQLRRRLAPKTRAVLADAVHDLERGGLTRWEIGTLPRSVERRQGSYLVRAYPALVDEGGTVGVRLFDTEAAQHRSMWRGTRRLLLVGTASPVRRVLAGLSNQEKLALNHHPHANITALFDDCLQAAADRLIAEGGGPAWDEAAFAELARRFAAGLPGTMTETVRLVARILPLAHDIERQLKGTGNLAVLPSLTDIREQLGELVPPGFVAATGVRRLPDLVRYLTAVQRRLDRLSTSPQRDRDLTERVARVRAAYDEERAAHGPGRNPAANPAAWADVRWMIEELRVSYFAQGLGTPYPVSDKRILRALDQLADAD